MKDNIKFFIGLDISKLTIDAAITGDVSKPVSLVIENTIIGLNQFFTKLRKDFSCKKSNTLIFAEDMGLYNTFLCSTSKNRRFNLILCTPLKNKTFNQYAAGEK